MLYKRRAILTALIAFFPVFGLLKLGSPWVTVNASFELTGEALIKDAQQHLRDPSAESIHPAKNVRWLQSKEAIETVLDSLPPHHAAALVENGETWNIRVRERLRSLACRNHIEAWQIGGKGLCSWLGGQLQYETSAERLEIMEKRLSIKSSHDDQHVTIAFRAPERDVAITIVNAFGDLLTARLKTDRQDLRRQVIRQIRGQLTTLSQRALGQEALTKAGKDGNETKEQNPDLSLLRKVTAAMEGAKDKLSSNDRAVLDRELKTIKAMTKDPLLSGPANRDLVAAEDKASPKAAESSLTVLSADLLLLLTHSDWAKPPIFRISESVTSGLSTPETAAIAFFIALMIGVASSLIWASRSAQSRHNDHFASPYANPHWPSMGPLRRTDPGEAI